MIKSPETKRKSRTREKNRGQRERNEDGAKKRGGRNPSYPNERRKIYGKISPRKG